MKKILPLLLVPSLAWAFPSSDWSGSAYLVSHWRMNDGVSGFGATLTDQTSKHPLTTNNTTNDETTNIFEGGHGQGLVSSNQFNCQANGTCTPNVGDFDFGSGTGPFSCFFYFYPTTSSIPEQLFGTNLGGLLFGGWQVYRDTGPVFCFESSQSLSFTSTKVCTTSAATINTGAMVMISMNGTDQRISMNGNAWEGTATQAGDITSPTSDFFIRGEGKHDFAGCWIGALDLPSFRKILVCDIDGSDCLCNDGDHTQYSSRPRHSSEGGLITGTMAPCDQANPSFDSTPPTTTSTTVVTTSTTITTTSTSTTTSTASPTTTSTSTTLFTTSTSTSTSVVTTSLATTTSTSSTSSTTILTCANGCELCNSSALGCCSGVCGSDGFCKLQQGHLPAVEPDCIYYNRPCSANCQCCGALVCELTVDGVNRCREPNLTTTTSTSSTTSTTTL